MPPAHTAHNAPRWEVHKAGISCETEQNGSKIWQQINSEEKKAEYTWMSQLSQ